MAEMKRKRKFAERDSGYGQPFWISWYSNPDCRGVGSHVWIGANSTILKGTMIGQNSVIGANAVVNGEVPEKVIFNIKREKFVRNEFEKWDRKSPN